MLLGLFAPFAPFLTEHMYQQFYRAHEDAVSLHLTRWPVADERWRGDRSAVDQLAVILDATRVLRSGQRLGNSARLEPARSCRRTAQAQALLDQIAEPLRVAARADAVVRGPAEHPSGVRGSRSGSPCRRAPAATVPAGTMARVRTIALEEHFWTPELAAPPGTGPLAMWGPRVAGQLRDLGQVRLADMDANGIDLQVISHVAPAAQGLAGAEGITRAREANDLAGRGGARAPAAVRRLCHPAHRGSASRG